MLELPGSPEESEREEIARLEAEIVRRREKVATSLGELQGRLQQATSWRHWVGDHPGAWLSFGVFLGFVVGGGARRR